MAANLEDVKRLRDMTGAGMMDCRKALEDAGGEVDRAVELLRERGVAKAARRVGRETANGTVEAYLHRTAEDYPPQVGAMVELNCETDFVAKGQDFRQLARELALHIAASDPRWTSRDEVPPETVAAERDLYRRRAEQEGKSEQALPRIVEGQLEDFFKQYCLLEQSYVRDPNRQVKDLIDESVSRLQENITVRRFARFSIKDT